MKEEREKCDSEEIGKIDLRLLTFSLLNGKIPETEFERELLKDLNEIKSRGRIIDIPSDW